MKEPENISQIPSDTPNLSISTASSKSPAKADGARPSLPSRPSQSPVQSPFPSNLLFPPIPFPPLPSPKSASNHRDAQGKYPKDMDEHIHQAFKNVELALQAAGGKGWEEVYSVTTYHVPMNQTALETSTKYFKLYAPHKPIWTALGVPR